MGQIWLCRLPPPGCIPRHTTILHSQKNYKKAPVSDLVIKFHPDVACPSTHSCNFVMDRQRDTSARSVQRMNQSPLAISLRIWEGLKQWIHWNMRFARQFGLPNSIWWAFNIMQISIRKWLQKCKKSKILSNWNSAFEKKRNAKTKAELTHLESWCLEERIRSP